MGCGPRLLSPALQTKAASGVLQALEQACVHPDQL